MSTNRGGAAAAGDVGSEHVADNFQDDVVENADVEEAVVRALPSPHRPTAKEVDDHYVSPLPYRNWCPICVGTRGREDAHTRSRTICGGKPIIARGESTRKTRPAKKTNGSLE